jgi:23S rRNA pseudouridine2605 synthase
MMRNQRTSGPKKSTGFNEKNSSPEKAKAFRSRRSKDKYEKPYKRVTEKDDEREKAYLLSKKKDDRPGRYGEKKKSLSTNSSEKEGFTSKKFHKSDSGFKKTNNRFTEKSDEKSFSKSDDKPFRKSDEKSFRKSDDRPFRKSDEKSFRKSDDKPFRKSDEKSFRKSDDKPFRKSDEKSFRKSDDKPFRKSDEKSFRKSDDRPFRKSDEKSFRKSDDRPFRKSDEKSFRKSDDKPFRKSDEKSFKKSDDKPFRKSDEKSYDKKGYSSYKKPVKSSFKKSFKPLSNDNNKEDLNEKGSTTRLNKYIANAGFCSRREADTYIETGVVTVNGKIITELGYKIKPGDKVLFGDKPVIGEKPVYILLNKPKDYITTSKDPQNRRTVFDLISNVKERVFAVGRLDRNTTGLLLLTNDGELADKLMHPRKKILKIYHVELDKKLSQKDLEALTDGIELEDGFFKPDEVSFVDNQDKKHVGIEIHSGRNRIVRRLFEELGYNVIKLDRVFYAGLTKKGLSRGDWRNLETREVGMLKML